MGPLFLRFVQFDIVQLIQASKSVFTHTVPTLTLLRLNFDNMKECFYISQPILSPGHVLRWIEETSYFFSFEETCTICDNLRTFLTPDMKYALAVHHRGVLCFGRRLYSIVHFSQPISYRGLALILYGGEMSGKTTFLRAFRSTVQFDYYFFDNPRRLKTVPRSKRKKKTLILDDVAKDSIMAHVRRRRAIRYPFPRNLAITMRNNFNFLQLVELINELVEKKFRVIVLACDKPNVNCNYYALL